jgi:AcrR family transcriptional regulator
MGEGGEQAVNNRNVDRGRTTRQHLIATATEQFATHGYEATSIESVLKASGVSRGSLYHHFASKEVLFAAVLDVLMARIGADLAAAMRAAGDAVAALRAGCLAWIRLAGDRVVQQIMLIDAPAVLGWQRFRELDEKHTLGGIRTLLGAAADSGRIDHQHVDVFAHIVLVTVNEVAVLVARSADPAAAMPAAESAVDEFLHRLLGT